MARGAAAWLLLLFVSPRSASADGMARLRGGGLGAAMAGNVDPAIFRPGAMAKLPRYLSNAELNAYLQWLAEEPGAQRAGAEPSGCGPMAKLEALGKSNAGHEVLGVTVAHPSLEQKSAPEYVFIAGMHGNEPLGRQLLLAFLETMCQAYHALENNKRSNAAYVDEASKLLTSIRVTVVPTINPDGFALRRRENVRGTDLNRDFPDQFRHGPDAMHNGRGIEQPETRLTMDLLRKRRFAAGANFHEGALVANYPWDGTAHGRGGYAGVPGDDATFKSLAQSYANLHPKMQASREFTGGITNGAAWYPLWGGMQDFAYLEGGCLMLTIELNDQKWPSGGQLPRLWEESRGAFFGHPLAALADAGVHGYVVDASTAQPVQGASVRLKGRPDNLRWTRVDPFGGFHLALANHERATLHVSAPGYAAREVPLEVPARAALTGVRVQLSRGPDASSGFAVDSASASSASANASPARSLEPPPPPLAAPPPPPPPSPPLPPPLVGRRVAATLLTRLVFLYAVATAVAACLLVVCARRRRRARKPPAGARASALTPL